VTFDHELVRTVRRSSMEGQVEYSFAHALIRDVCYAQIPRAERAQRHRLAAAWIKRMAGERSADHAEILAAHYTTALELAQAAKDPRAGELASSTARYLMLAGDRAVGIDVEAAERHYTKAFAMTGPDHPECWSHSVPLPNSRKLWPTAPRQASCPTSMRRRPPSPNARSSSLLTSASGASPRARVPWGRPLRTRPSGRT
jgi:hypothetical protein